MIFKKGFAVAASVVAIGALPILAFGADPFAEQGIVNGSLPADEYTWSYLFSIFGVLAQTLIAIATIVAAMFIMYGGWLYLSSAGDTGKIEQAHKIFKDVGIGLGLLVGAWLIVVTLLRSLEAQPWFLQIFKQK